MSFKVTIIGTRLTTPHTFQALVQRPEPVSVRVFEKGNALGTGVHSSPETATKSKSTNIASIEIPALSSTYLDWMLDRPAPKLPSYGSDSDGPDEERCDAGLKTVFDDNYAAVPSRSIRRHPALRDGGVFKNLALGEDCRRGHCDTLRLQDQHFDPVRRDLAVPGRLAVDKAGAKLSSAVMRSGKVLCHS